MTTSNTFSRSTGIALLAAGTVLLATAHGASARGGSGGTSHASHSGGFVNPIRNTIHPIIVRNPGVTATKRNNHRDDKLSRKRWQEELGTRKRNGTPAPVRVESILHPTAKPLPIASALTTTLKPPANTIHPIINPDPAKPDPAKPTQPTAGMLPPHDPVGNTHPNLNPNGVATVSNGVTKANLPNGDGGLLVTSKSPGTITVSNGTNSVTLQGGSVVLSGAVSVGAAAGLQVSRHPNGDVAVAVNAPAAAPTAAPPTAVPSGPKSGLTGTGPIDEIKGIGGQAAELGRLLGRIPDGFGTGVARAGKDIGNGIVDLGKDLISIGGPTPPPKTSTTTQQ